MRNSRTAMSSSPTMWCSRMDRIPKVPNSPSNFAAYTKPVASTEIVDPHTIRLHTQRRVPAAADLPRAVLHHQPQGRRGHGDRGLQQRQGGDRHRAVPLRLVQAGRSRRAGAQRRLLGTEAGLADGRPTASSPTTPRAPRRCSPATSTSSTSCRPRTWRSCARIPR